MFVTRVIGKRSRPRGVAGDIGGRERVTKRRHGGDELELVGGHFGFNGESVGRDVAATHDGGALNRVGRDVTTHQIGTSNAGAPEVEALYGSESSHDGGYFL